MLTKGAYLDAFDEVLALAGGPIEAHGVLLGCAEDPAWVAELKALHRNSAFA